MKAFVATAAGISVFALMWTWARSVLDPAGVNDTPIPLALGLMFILGVAVSETNRR